MSLQKKYLFMFCSRSLFFLFSSLVATLVTFGP